jgi:hypothetical protein
MYPMKIEDKLIGNKYYEFEFIDHRINMSAEYYLI